MQAARIGTILKSGQAGERTLVNGWVRTRRDSKGGFSFIELNDGSSLKNLQIVADAKLANYESEVLKLQVGACISVEGALVQSPGKGQSVELKAESICIFGPSEAAYPLQKKGHSLEFLREIAHLRPRTNTFGAVMRVRNALAAAVHEHFQSRGFVYVNTPIITASDAEGAGAMFQVTTLDPAALPRDDKGAIDWKQDFFGQRTYLTVSGQLEGEPSSASTSRMSCGVNEGGCGDDRRSTGPFGVIGADWVSGRGGSRSGFCGGRGDSRTGFCGGRGDVVGARDELGVASAWASRGATREATRSETARNGVERMPLPIALLVPASTGRQGA